MVLPLGLRRAAHETGPRRSVLLAESHITRFERLYQCLNFSEVRHGLTSDPERTGRPLVRRFRRREAARAMGRKRGRASEWRRIFSLTRAFRDGGRHAQLAMEARSAFLAGAALKILDRGSEVVHELKDF